MTLIQRHARSATSTGTVLELIAAQIARTPEAPAVADASGRMTYAELHERATGVAAALHAAGVRPGDRVGLTTRRDRRAVAVIVGILYAGAVYVPLDPSYPVARREQMAATAQLTLLVAAEPLADVPTVGLGILADPADGPAPPVTVTPADLAYLIFTSGSTGAPKGVQVTHGNLRALLDWCVEQFGAAFARTVTTTSLNFDPSIIELFTPLAVGGEVYALDGPFALMAEGAQPTYLQGVPSVLLELALAGHLPTSLRVLVTGGEPLLPKVARTLLERTGLPEMFNAYGPTEATVQVTVERVTLRTVEDITIGREINGTRIVLLSPEGDEVGVGQLGELTVLGAQVAAGYAGAVDRDVFAPRRGQPAYRTGDLAVRRLDGRIELHGRIDRQVKIRGFRVELPEIENQLLSVPGVRQAVVLASDRGTAHARLVAYFVSDRPLPADELRRALQSRLQSYMVPSDFVAVASLPRTVNGKIDLAALPALTPEVPSLAAPARDGLAETGAVSLASIVAEALQLSEPPESSADLVSDLKATSLSLIRILTLIEDRLHVRIPVAAVLHQTTVADLTRLVNGERRRAVIHLNQRGTQHPLLLTAAYIADVLRYRLLAARLPDVPITIVLARQPDEENHPATIGEMAENVIAEMDPNHTGRYRLGGHSAGGLVAYETARRLSLRGFTVDAVILFDTPRPVSRLGYHWGDLVMNLPEFLTLNWGAKLRRMYQMLAKRSQRFRAASSSELTSSIAAGDALNNLAVLRYRAETVPGLRLLAVLTTSQGIVMAMGHRQLGWNDTMSRQLMVAPVAGRHTTIFDPPNLATLVARVEQALAA